MRLLHTIESGVKQLPWIVSRPLAGLLDPAAIEFYRRLRTGGYQPDYLINVLPTHKVIYVIVPKVASTQIRATLARATDLHSRSLKSTRRLKFRGPYGPRSMTASSFYRLATDAQTLRFSFVRNPYVRAVSFWADKFRDKPLVGGDPFIDLYLAKRHEIDASLPAGADRTLSFSDFVTFVAATATSRCSMHIQTQDDILSMPGINLDFIGKVESFSEDFVRVLDHLRADGPLRRQALSFALNKSDYDPWPDYYTGELADRIYRAYEIDFDRFGYPRAITRPNYQPNHSGGGRSSAYVQRRAATD